MTELETRLITLVKSMQDKQDTIIQELKSTAESIGTLNTNQNLLTASLERFNKELDYLKNQLSRLPFTVWLKRVNCPGNPGDPLV